MNTLLLKSVSSLNNLSVLKYIHWFFASGSPVSWSRGVGLVLLVRVRVPAQQCSAASLFMLVGHVGRAHRVAAWGLSLTCYSPREEGRAFHHYHYFQKN